MYAHVCDEAGTSSVACSVNGFLCSFNKRVLNVRMGHFRMHVGVCEQEGSISEYFKVVCSILR